jgi:hypothetical protein
MKYYILLFILLLANLNIACKKKEVKEDKDVNTNEVFFLDRIVIDGNASTLVLNGISRNPTIKLIFSEALNANTISTSISLMQGNNSIALVSKLENANKEVILTPVAALQALTKFTLTINTTISSAKNSPLLESRTVDFVTALDSSNKFPILSDEDLLHKIQEQTFKYFWDFGHPVSGMARERNTSQDIVATGGTGFGVMAIVCGVNRGFISRAQGAQRISKITQFLLNQCTHYHGAFAHWINGVSGATIPFSTNDNGGDLVETSLLLQGLLTAKQYFSNQDVVENAIRNDIDSIYNRVEWNWYRQNNQDVLYWHWSPDKAWIINQKISGWNEALIVYVLAASAPNPLNRISPNVYSNGWARNGAMVNNNSYYGLQLPLGPSLGGPLFLSQYSFLAINPNGLQDAYANYKWQTERHAKINFEYCKVNAKKWYGYSEKCWGLTACDVPLGYYANAPGAQDIGVIAPTAAIGSLPFTPTESLSALRFFYYQLGDKLWGTYGFYDAFKLNDPWFANSYIAIDQGPIIIMIENYRTQLIWNLFTSVPEIKAGMTSLGFTAPYL